MHLGSLRTQRFDVPRQLLLQALAGVACDGGVARGERRQHLREHLAHRVHVW